jgi:NAD-dependent dihydropyrimidine dehydrogenase PreA subunit
VDCSSAQRNQERATSNEQLDGVFIAVEVDDAVANDADLARKLEEVCPVDIFADEDGKGSLVEGNLDECVLCELCIEAAPPGAVVVKKLYDDTELKR